MPRNLDYPMPMHGRMLRQRLWETQIDARMLYDTLRDDDAVPAWTLDKVARGAENVHQVSRYLRFKASNPIAWGAVPDAPPSTAQLAGAAAIMVLALTGANALIALAIKAIPDAPAKPRRRRPRPTYYAL